MVVQSRDIPTLHNLAPRPRHLLMVISQIIHGFGWSIHDIGELLLVNICQIRHNHICRICRESGFQCSTPNVTHVTPNTCNLKCITTSLLWGHMIQFLLASNLAPKISTISKQSIASHLEKLNKNSKMSGLTLIPDNMSICGIFCCLPFMFSLSIPTTSCGKKKFPVPCLVDEAGGCCGRWIPSVSQQLPGFLQCLHVANAGVGNEKKRCRLG